MIQETAHISFWKSSSYFPFIFGCKYICDLLNINHILLTVLAALMFLDFLSGWYKSIRLEIPITISKMRNGFLSKIIVFVSILTIGLVIFAFGIVSPKAVEFFDMTNYIQWVIMFFILNESYSISGNYISGKNKKEIEETDFFVLLLSRVRGTIGTNLESAIDKIDKKAGNVK